MDELRSLIRAVPDFPSPGILFRDITPLLADAGAFARVVGHLAERFRDAGVELVAGVESRGFIFAAPLALELGAGFVPVRKRGKLPARTLSREYALEYGTSHLEVHVDAVRPGQRVLLLDDVLATGGTAAAAVGLLRELGGEVVGAAFVVELEELRGRAALDGVDTFSLLGY